MGERPSAKIVYGVPLYHEDMENGEEIEQLMEDFYGEDEDLGPSDFFEMINDTLKKDYPTLEITWEGYFDSPTYILIAKASKLETDWDDGPIPIPFSEIMTAPVMEWDMELRRFLGFFKLPPVDADWLLASFLG
jgi:hypothetical protein